MKLISFYLFLALTLATPALSQAPLVAPHKAISAVTFDWNKDARPDRAVLIDVPEQNSEDADLYIYLSKNNEMQLYTHLKAAAWQGKASGTQPSLRLGPKGALQILSQNTAIGRDRWERTVTLSYRKGAFVVSGLTMRSYDALNPKNSHRCDINLLTGRGLVDKKRLRLKPKATIVAHWTEDLIPAACYF
jgi:hypothetical protein